MNGDSEMRGILSDQVNRLLGDTVTKDRLEQVETGAWPADLWQSVEENGLTRVLVPEDDGGVGGGWREAEAVLRAAGKYQAPVPLAEGIIGGAMVAGAGLSMPDGVVSIAPVRRDEELTLSAGGQLSGTATRVPWGRNADHLIVLARGGGDCHVAVVAKGGWRVEEDANIAAEPRDTCHFDGAAVVASAPWDGADMLSAYRLGAMARSAQIAGALEFLLEQSVQYANDRSQFGRPIGKFQAVQQELARLAGEVAASGAAAEAACRAADQGEAAFEIAVAKQRASEAATTGTSIAHQAHGAIGFTYEHALHFATRRLWSWRAEFGSESYWAEDLGRSLAGRGAEALWPFLTERTATTG